MYIWPFAMEHIEDKGIYERRVLGEKNFGTKTSHSYRLIQSCRSISVINGGVAQPGLEHANASRQVGGSKPLPATISINKTGCPVLSAQGSRNRQTREGQADYTLVGNQYYTPSRASVKGGPMNILKPEKKLAVISALTAGCSNCFSERGTTWI